MSTPTQPVGEAFLERAEGFRAPPASVTPSSTPPPLLAPSTTWCKASGDTIRSTKSCNCRGDVLKNLRF